MTVTAGGTTTDLFYSNQGQVLEEMVGGSATARYVWSPVYVNALVLRDFATGSPGTLNQRLWVQQDANWNVTALVNGSGVVVERYVYSPYGVLTIYNATYSTVLSSSAYSWVYGYQGMRYDPISGFYLAQHRWYSPTLERWTVNDPTGFKAGDNNFYRFVGNNPLDHTDPSGLRRWSSLGAQGGGEGGGWVGAILGLGAGILVGPFLPYGFLAPKVGFLLGGGAGSGIGYVVGGLTVPDNLPPAVQYDLGTKVGSVTVGLAFGGGAGVWLARQLFW